ncbi:MAG: zinc ribbon domain-containing protein [bacterium]|nr:zinc ribbon domain-containing protein [bacterium]
MVSINKDTEEQLPTNRPAKSFCTQCGTELMPGMRFCHSCGAPAVQISADTAVSGAHPQAQEKTIDNASTAAYSESQVQSKIATDEQADAASRKRRQIKTTKTAAVPGLAASREAAASAASARQAASGKSRQLDDNAGNDRADRTDNNAEEDEDDKKLDYKLAVNYFKPKPPVYLTVLKILAGVIVFLVFFDTSSVWNWFAASTWVIWWLIVGFWRPSDSEYDQMTYNYNSSLDLPTRALDELGLLRKDVSTIPPIIISSYDFKEASLFRLGEDNMWRTNSFETAVIYFGADSMHIYTHSFLTTPGKLDLKKVKKMDVDDDKIKDDTPVETAESTAEYYYKDIVSVKLASEQVCPNNANQSNQRTYKQTICEITTTGGSNVKIALPANDLKAKESIKNMRDLIKEKKAQA